MTVNGCTASITLGDAVEGMRALPDQSFDLAIVDPPYGSGIAASWKLDGDHGLAGFGGAWNINGHSWDMLTGDESFALTVAYMTELKRLVRPTRSLFVHSTYHNSGIVNVVARNVLGLEIINEIVWYKRNAFPNLTARRLTASHETIHWMHTGNAKSRRYRFNATDVKAAEFTNDPSKKAGKQMRTVWDVPNNKDKSELAHGRHPTQKPLSIPSRLLLIAGKPGGDVLVPFAGSGTEMVAAVRYGMNVTGFEMNPEYRDLAIRRLNEEHARDQSNA